MDHDEPRVNPREAVVLERLVREHLRSGQPVGSAAIARSQGLGLCAASVRRIMADLEDRGFLTHPHTSAGRVPTDLGYRVHVDAVVDLPNAVPADQARQIRRTLSGRQHEFPDLLEAASRVLSRESQQVGLVLAPDLARIALERIEFIPVSTRRVVAVVVGRSGVVHQRMLTMDAAIESEQLERIGRYLTGEFGGLTLPRILAALRRRHSEERETFDRLQQTGLALCRKAVEADLDEAAIFVEGASNLLESPEFADLDVVRALLRTLEEKQRLIDLLGRLLEGHGVQVVIGEENPDAGFSECAIVASSYSAGERKLGTIGVIGPRRMPYRRVIALVDHLARSLTEVLSRQEN